MGWLHAGHRALIERARAENATTVVSIFVNPKQFGDPADLARYPRNEARDVEICAESGADLVFAPTVDEVYPPGFDTTVQAGAIASPLEGAARPGHFDGVATVVSILFNVVGAERAYFGQKDAQQLLVIRHMARDLAIPIEVIAHPTVREPDGLAMSSRNVHLSPAERAAAPVLRRGTAGGARGLGGRRAIRRRSSASACGRSWPRSRLPNPIRLGGRRRDARRARRRSTARPSSRWPSASARPASSTTSRSRDIALTDAARELIRHPDAWPSNR